LASRAAELPHGTIDVLLNVQVVWDRQAAVKTSRVYLFIIGFFDWQGLCATHGALLV